MSGKTKYRFNGLLVKKNSSNQKAECQSEGAETDFMKTNSDQNKI